MIAKSIQFNVRITEDQNNKISTYAQKLDCSRSTIIRLLIERHLKKSVIKKENNIDEITSKGTQFNMRITGAQNEKVLEFSEKFDCSRSTIIRNLIDNQLEKIKIEKEYNMLVR